MPDQKAPDEGQGESENGGKPSLRYRLAVALQKGQFIVYTTLVLLLVVLGILWPRMFISVEAGTVGVMYRYFTGGTVTNRLWGEGLNVIPPWDSLTMYEVRLQQEQLKFDVLSEEGLTLGVEVSVRFKPNKVMLGFLHQDVGPDYFERLIKPEIQAHVRRTFGNRPAHEVYSSAKDLLQEFTQLPMLGRIEDEEDGIAPRSYVIVQELKLVDIELPPIVEQAIADKYKQEQLMLEYRYKLDREQNEAERKRTEAAGIRDYALIAGKVDLLRWRSIEATLELAKSQNTKVVVIGGGQSGTQMLMSLETLANSTPAPPASGQQPRAAPAPAPPAPGQQAPADGPIAPRAEPAPAPPIP